VESLFFMDAKITLSFRADIIARAKEYAEAQGISLSRLTEVLLGRLVSGQYRSLDDFPVSDWVNSLSEPEASYLRKPRTSKAMRAEMHDKKKSS
jgi:hypothetical protein